MLSHYLSRERAKLLQLKTRLQDQIQTSNQSMTSFKSMHLFDEMESSLADVRVILELVETCLIQAYVAINSPLLISLLRVENSCNYDKTVEILLKHQKTKELVEFYKAKGHHEKALKILS